MKKSAEPLKQLAVFIVLGLFSSPMRTFASSTYAAVADEH